MTEIALRSMARHDPHPVSGIVHVTPSSRMPTLEANRLHGHHQSASRNPDPLMRLEQWLKSQLKDEESLDKDDSTQALLREIIKDKNTSYDRRSLRHLLSDYAWFKEKSCHFVAPDLIQTWMLWDGTDSGIIKSRVDAFSVTPGDTFSSLTNQLIKNLLEQRPNSLRLIAVTERADPTYDDSFLTARHRFWATVRKRYRSLPFVPGRIIDLLVKEALDLPFDLHNVATPCLHDARRKTFVPPLQRPLPANFDPDQSDNDRIVLTWERHAPQFKHDIDIYMREPHRTWSPSRRAEMRLWQPSSLNPSTNEKIIVIYFNHYDSLRSFTSMKNQSIQNQAHASSTGQAWCTESEVLLSVYALLEVLVSDTVNFLQECSIELESMNARLRDSPTSNKVRYLLHLNDRRSLAVAAVTHALKVSNAIRRWKDMQSDTSQIWDAGVTWSKRAARLSENLNFLRRHLQTMDAEIKGLQQLLRERLELAHNRRGFLLTIIAAIYLPLSFATSFFGMNITTDTPPTEDGFSNYTSDWIANSPGDYRNATKAIVSAIGTSGTMTFTWQAFGISAACLVLTLPLSLALGTILRTLYQSAIYYSKYWRIATIPGGAAFVVCSAFGDMIPGCWYAFLAFNIVLALYAYFAAYNAWRKQAIGDSTAKPLRWTVWSFLITICFIMESSLYIYGLTAVPWASLLYVWGLSRIRAWRKRNNK